MTNASETDGILAETWVDVENEHGTRNADLRDAWEGEGFEMVSGAPAVEIDNEEPLAAELFVMSVTPEWLASADGSMSYSSTLFQSYERRLHRAQKGEVLRQHRSGQTARLQAFAEG